MSKHPRHLVVTETTSDEPIDVAAFCDAYARALLAEAATPTPEEGATDGKARTRTSA